MGPSSSDLLARSPGRSDSQADPPVSDSAPHSQRSAGPTRPVKRGKGAASSRSARRRKPAGGSDHPPRKTPPKRRSLASDLAAVAGAEGLTQEVALLRAAIHRLAEDGDAAEDVKVLAELRHQVEALCRALKTQQSLDGHDGDALATELAQALDELGDGPGASR